MVESKDNVKVAIRIRPLNEREIDEGSKKCISVQESGKKVCIGDHKVFTYDYVADEAISQETIFEMIGKSIASSCMSGYNGTIFAYGQTGSGKTFTIQGPADDEISADSRMYHLRGILPRCFEYIFSMISSLVKEENVEFLVKCSYLEIYQEQVSDLLDPNPQNLQIREDMKKGVYVDGIIEAQVTNVMETYKILKTGSRNRHVSSTSMNKESSRSHSVFSLNIESKSNFEGLVNFKSSRFNLIDLAGSERQKSTACVGERLKEAGMINKSLSALGNVINSLVEISEGKSRHVPYRDSRLTYLLKDSLGGNSKTLIIANVSSAVSSLSETLSTLKFAQRAKLIKNSAVINEDTSGTVLMLKNEVKRLKEELENVKVIAELAVAQCPKCAGIKQIEMPHLLKNFEKNTNAEMLLESNLRTRIELERQAQERVGDKDSIIESLKGAVSRMENKINHDKMILKFRNATIAKLQNGEEDKDIAALRKENEMLREEIENNPFTAKLYAENKILSEEIAEIKLEAESGYGSYKQKYIELQQFTEKLCDSMKSSNLEREKLKKIFTELSEGKNFDTIFKEFDDKYSLEIQELRGTIKDLTKENAQIIAENKMIHENYVNNLENEENLLESKIEDVLFSPRLSLMSDEESRRLQDKLEKREKEIEELKLKFVIEMQAKDVLQIEKLGMEKSIRELSEENLQLRTLKEKYIIIVNELEFTKNKYEEKYTELMQATQEIDNLTESSEYLKSEITHISNELGEKRQKISELEHLTSGLEKQSSEQAEMIIALQDPLGNKTLALAISEREQYKQRSIDLDQELVFSKKLGQELMLQVSVANKHCEEVSFDLNAAKAALAELKDLLALSKNTITRLKESEQNLLEEIESLKEINSREKHHGDIMKERLMKKHSDALVKLTAENTELVKEIDIMKNTHIKLQLDFSEVKNKEHILEERVGAKERANERIIQELIEAKVLIEKNMKEYNENTQKAMEDKEKADNELKLASEDQCRLKELSDRLEKQVAEIIRDMARENQKHEEIIVISQHTIKILSEEAAMRNEKFIEIQSLYEKAEEFIKDLMNSQEKLKHDILSITEKNNEYNLELNQKITESEFLQAELVSSRNIIKELNECIMSNEKEISNSSLKLEFQVKKNSELEGELNSINQNLKEITNSYQKQLEICKNQDSKINANQSKISELETVIDKLNLELSGKESALIELELQIKNNYESIGELNIIRQKLEEQLTNSYQIQLEITKNQAIEINAHQSKISELKTIIDKLNAELSEKESALINAQTKMQEFERSLVIKIHENNTIEAKHVDICGKLSQIENTLASLQNALDEEISKNKSINIELESGKGAQCELLEKYNYTLVKYSELEKTLSIETNQNQNMVKRIEEISTEKIALESEIDSIKTKLKELKAKNSEMHARNEELIKDLDELLRLKDKNRAIENDLEIERNKSTKLESTLSNLNEEKINIEVLLKQENCELLNQIGDLKNIIESKESIMEELKNEISEIKLNKDKLELDLNEYSSKNAELFEIVEQKNTKNKEQELLCINLLNEKEQINIFTEVLKGEIENLLREFEDIKSKLDESSRTVFILTNNNKDCKFNLEKHIEKNLKLETEVLTKSSIIETLQKEKAEKEQELRDYNKKHYESVESLEYAQLKLQKLNEDLEKSREIAKENEISLNTTLEELCQKKQTIDKISVDASNAASQLILAEKQISNLESSISVSEKMIIELEQTCENLKNELRGYIKLNADLSIFSEELEKHKEEVILKQTQLEENLKLLNLKHINSKSKSKSKQDNLNSTISDMKDKIDRLQSETEEKLKEIAIKDQENSILSKEKSSLSIQLSEICSSQEFLRNELEISHNEIKNLKEKLMQQSESLKASNTNANFSRDEIVTMKKCIEEKNRSILELKDQVQVLEQDLERIQNDKYYEKQCESLTNILEEKEKELKDLKSREILSKAKENEAEIKKAEIEIAIKKQEAVKTELNSVKSELSSSLNARENLMCDMKSLKNDDMRNKKEIAETKKLIAQLKADNLRFIKDITKLNEENIKLIEHEENAQSSLQEKYLMRIKKLEEVNLNLENQVKLKASDIEKYSNKLNELRKNNPEINEIRKELEKQYEELNSLTEALAKIADFVFSLPTVSTDPEESSIVENIIRAINQLYLDLQSKDRELNEKKGMRRGEAVSQSTGNFKKQLSIVSSSLNSPSNKVGQLRSPSMKTKGSR